jgi:hypothetical protein
VFAALQKHLLSSPLLLRRTSLDAANFGDTRGFVSFFSPAGIAVLRACPHFAPLLPFFDRVRLPSANAWVMNALRTTPSAPGNETAAAGGHVDNTLLMAMPQAVWNGETHQTSVLYVRVPPAMTDGRLLLWQPDLSGGRESSMELSARSEPVLGEPVGEQHADGTCQGYEFFGPPAVRISPVENKLVSFRGDAYHSVQRHRVAGSEEGDGGGIRASLVLEQYILDEAAQAAAPYFVLSGMEDETQAVENAELAVCAGMLGWKEPTKR